MKEKKAMPAAPTRKLYRLISAKGRRASNDGSRIGSAARRSRRKKPASRVGTAASSAQKGGVRQKPGSWRRRVSVTGEAERAPAEGDAPPKSIIRLARL